MPHHTVCFERIVFTCIITTCITGTRHRWYACRVRSGERRRSCRDLLLDLPYKHESREMIIRSRLFRIFLNIRFSVLSLPSPVITFLLLRMVSFRCALLGTCLRVDGGHAVQHGMNVRLHHLPRLTPEQWPCVYYHRVKYWLYTSFGAQYGFTL